MRARNWHRAEAARARLAAALASWLRWLNGDTAYARYRAHAQSAHPGRAPLTRAEFFREETERRWGGIRRCC